MILKNRNKQYMCPISDCTFADPLIKNIRTHLLDHRNPSSALKSLPDQLESLQQEESPDPQQESETVIKLPSIKTLKQNAARKSPQQKAKPKRKELREYFRDDNLLDEKPAFKPLDRSSSRASDGSGTRLSSGRVSTRPSAWWIADESLGPPAKRQRS